MDSPIPNVNPPCDKGCIYRNICKYHDIACKGFITYVNENIEVNPTTPNRSNYLQLYRKQQ